MNKEIICKKRTLKYENNWMKVYEDEIQRPSGNDGIYGVVEKAEFALIIPVEENNVYIVEQYRYALKERTLEFPQGSFETSDKDFLENARRELKEETGLEAENIVELGKFYTAVGFCNQIGHVFVATGMKQNTPDLDDTEEDLVCKKIPIEEFEELCRNNFIKDSGTLSAWLMYKMHCRG